MVSRHSSFHRLSWVAASSVVRRWMWVPLVAALAIAAGSGVARAEKMLYVATGFGARVLAYDLSSDDPATIAGSQSTLWNGTTYASSVAVDGSGNVYSGWGASGGGQIGRVRKISPSGTLLGEWFSGAENVGAMAASGGALYYWRNSYNLSPQVARLNSDGTIQTYAAPPTTDGLGGLAIDHTGQIFTSTGSNPYAGNGTVYKVHPNGTTTLFWDAGYQRASFFLAFSPISPDLFVGTYNSDNTVNTWNVNTGGTANKFINGTWGSMAFDGTGNLWITGNNSIRKYDPSGNFLYSFSTGTYSPSSIALSQNAAGVPEIDPAALGSVLALVGGVLGLVERRRLATDCV